MGSRTASSFGSRVLRVAKLLQLKYFNEFPLDRRSSLKVLLFRPADCLVLISMMTNYRILNSQLAYMLLRVVKQVLAIRHAKFGPWIDFWPRPWFEPWSGFELVSGRAWALCWSERLFVYCSDFWSWSLSDLCLVPSLNRWQRCGDWERQPLSPNKADWVSGLGATRGRYRKEPGDNHEYNLPILDHRLCRMTFLSFLRHSVGQMCNLLAFND